MKTRTPYWSPGGLQTEERNGLRQPGGGATPPSQRAALKPGESPGTATVSRGQPVVGRLTHTGHTSAGRGGKRRGSRLQDQWGPELRPAQGFLMGANPTQFVLYVTKRTQKAIKAQCFLQVQPKPHESEEDEQRVCFIAKERHSP